MDFGALPPEVNSLRMYSGPGSAPMLAAVTAWDSLAAELRSTADAYETVISTLTSDEWLGPASASMVAAVTPYLAWMTITGMQAEQTARQAAAAAGVFESAFAMTVPPPVVAANRAQLAALVATNLIGQNPPAIAATEAAYGEMWAQDAAAMYGYATGSAAAATLTPFTEPAQTTNPSGQADQAEAVTQAAASAGGSLAQSELPQLMSAVPDSLQGLASPAAASPLDAIPGTGLLADILNFLDGNDGNPYGIFLNSSLMNGFVSAGYVSPALVGPAVWAARADINAVALGAQEGVAVPPMGSGEGNPGWIPADSPASPIGVPPLGTVTPASWSTAEVSAGTNKAALIGRLSVPQSWTAATAVANHAGAAAAGGGWTSTAVPEAAAGMPGVPGMPAVGAYGHGFGSAPRYGFRPTVMGRPPAAG
ncbi:putative PPE family protein PPE29 [Mycobacterium simulans]|uniref:Putative PPE family protein PPE29 n=1 Tax=Mycobacterium simulans TaxID=627089 RepID=A0A7Z7IN08_9MYCO|nr:PPE family protein [Mycobacterium simulans]SOJ55368.1 putative PPE family protein PPE29 [Mycobacterium simulans]